MALFKMLRGNEIHLPTSIVDGQVYFCKDTKNIYIDCGDSRYRIAAQYADKLRYETDGNTVEIDPSVILTDSNYATKIGVASDSNDGLMSIVDKKKLDTVEDGAQVNIIDGISDEFIIDVDGKILNINTIDQSKIVGLVDALSSKVTAVDGSRLMLESEGDKLATIATNAEVNVIDIFQVNGVAMTITDKTVNLLSSDIVKSSDEITVAEDGTLGVGTISTDKLVQGSYTLILNGGSTM